MVVFWSSFVAWIPADVHLVLLASLLVQNHIVYNANCTRGEGGGDGRSGGCGRRGDVEDEDEDEEEEEEDCEDEGDDDEHRDDGVDHDIKLPTFVAILL